MGAWMELGWGRLRGTGLMTAAKEARRRRWLLRGGVYHLDVFALWAVIAAAAVTERAWNWGYAAEPQERLPRARRDLRAQPDRRGREGTACRAFWWEYQAYLPSVGSRVASACFDDDALRSGMLDHRSALEPRRTSSPRIRASGNLSSLGAGWFGTGHMTGFCELWINGSVKGKTWTRISFQRWADMMQIVFLSLTSWHCSSITTLAQQVPECVSQRVHNSQNIFLYRRILLSVLIVTKYLW